MVMLPISWRLISWLWKKSANTLVNNIFIWEWLKTTWIEKKWKEEESKCPLYICHYLWQIHLRPPSPVHCLHYKSTQIHFLAVALAISEYTDSMFCSLMYTSSSPDLMNISLIQFHSISFLIYFLWRQRSLGTFYSGTALQGLPTDWITEACWQVTTSFLYDTFLQKTGRLDSLTDT